MRTKVLILIIFIMLYESIVFAQNKYNFSQFATESLEFIQQPLKWGGSDYLKLGSIAVGGGLVMLVDQPIRDAVMRDQKYYYSVPIVFGRMYGELYSPIALFAGFATYSLITDDEWSRKVAFEIGQACIYSGSIDYILKVAIGRGRPMLNNNTEGAGMYRPFTSFFREDYHSLPGGHSTAAFAISTVLSRNVKPVWLKVLFYAPAVLTMTSRVYQNWHWTSSCLIGAAFGYYIATWVVDKHEVITKSDSLDSGQSLIKKIQFQPYVSGDFYGLNVSIKIL